MLVLNYPVNPTGVTYTPDEVRALADLLKDYNVAILDDEIYADLLYEGEHLPMAKPVSYTHLTLPTICSV